jgi:hypothetical protein
VTTRQAEWHGWNDDPKHGMQTTKSNARNDQITGQGRHSTRAGTDVSWRNGATVQRRLAGAARQQAREATAPTKATVQCGSATRLRKDELTTATQLGPSQGGVSCAWGPPGGLLVLKIHVERRKDGAWRLQHRRRHVLAAPATTHG